MRYTPNLGLPVAEGTDTKDQYADSVEGPTKDALDTLLWPAAARGDAGTVSVTGSWVEVPMTWINVSPTAQVSGNGFTGPEGLYLINLRYNAANNAAAGYVHWRWGGTDIGGSQTIASVGAVWHTVTCFAHLSTFPDTLTVVGSPTRSVNYTLLQICQVTPGLLAAI